MASTITTANGSKIYGPGKLSEERLQHELALRRCQWPRSSPRRRPVVLPAGGHGFSPVAASCFSPPAF